MTAEFLSLEGALIVAHIFSHLKYKSQIIIIAPYQKNSTKNLKETIKLMKTGKDIFDNTNLDCI